MSEVDPSEALEECARFHHLDNQLQEGHSNLAVESHLDPWDLLGHCFACEAFLDLDGSALAFAEPGSSFALEVAAAVVLRGGVADAWKGRFQDHPGLGIVVGDTYEIRTLKIELFGLINYITEV